MSEQQGRKRDGHATLIGTSDRVAGHHVTARPLLALVTERAVEA